MIGSSNGIGNNYQQYAQGDAILSKSYSYKNGKGQETVYYAKDCLELSLESFTISPDADNYEDIKNMLKAQSASKIASMPNQMFYETSEIMSDYYSGKLSRDEVKNIFKEYFYHACDVSADTGIAAASVNSTRTKLFATRYLAGLYEYFSRANTRQANAQNRQEGQALMESHGLRWEGTFYYNSDWYYACEEMQELFRETANELADELGAEHVDFEYVEKNTKFKIDGGITYNGVWDAVEWQLNYDRGITGTFLDNGMVPPKGFVYCATYWDEDVNFKKHKDHSFVLFLLAAVKNTDQKESLLLDESKYFHSSKWEQNDIYRSAMDFLKNFNINWNLRNNRLEFLYVR